MSHSSSLCQKDYSLPQRHNTVSGFASLHSPTQQTAGTSPSRRADFTRGHSRVSAQVSYEARKAVLSSDDEWEAQGDFQRPRVFSQGSRVSAEVYVEPRARTMSHSPLKSGDKSQTAEIVNDISDSSTFGSYDSCATSSESAGSSASGGGGGEAEAKGKQMNFEFLDDEGMRKSGKAVFSKKCESLQEIEESSVSGRWE